MKGEEMGSEMNRAVLVPIYTRSNQKIGRLEII